jgi:hypothetical protein
VKEDLPVGWNGVSAWIRRLAEAAEVLNKLGTSTILLLILALFFLAYFGYIRSPLSDIQMSIKTHDDRVMDLVARRVELDRKLTQTLDAIAVTIIRMERVQQLRMCSEIKDPDLRRRCLE